MDNPSVANAAAELKKKTDVEAGDVDGATTVATPERKQWMRGVSLVGSDRNSDSPHNNLHPRLNPRHGREGADLNGVIDASP